MKAEPTEVQRRIIAALQVDGRASWSRIAAVLDIPERSVARNGAWLLENGLVTVAAIRHREHSMLVACTCPPGAARIAGEALSARGDTSFCYQVTGAPDLVVEMHYDGDAGQLLALQLPATPGGVTSFVAYPVLKYFKTVRGWRAGTLGPAEERALRRDPDRTSWKIAQELGPRDEQIIEVLQQDGRARLESVARRVAMSETSVARRIDWLLNAGQISIRALVEPATVGLPVEALLWISTPPARMEELGRRLAARPEVRYAAAVAGDCQLVVDVTVPSQAALYNFVSDGAWAELIRQMRISLVVHARKRGGRLVDS